MNEFLENKGSDLNASNKANATNNLSMRNISGDSPLFELADKLKALKDEKKQKEIELKNISDLLFGTETKLSELMTLSEIQNFTHSGTTFSLKTSLKASTVSGKKEELYTLLKNSGYGDLITETINPSSLSAFVKEQMSENEDKLPSFLSGLINVFEKNTVSTRKYRK